MEKMREEFEAWAVVNNMRVDRQKTMLGADMGRYDFGPTQGCYEVWDDAWQASRAAKCVVLPDSERSVDCGDVLYRSDVEEALDAAGIRYT